MKETILNVLKCLAFLALVTIVLFINKMSNDKQLLQKSETPKLAIYGDNIDSTYMPYIKDGKIYLSSKTIGNFIDNNILYDVNTKKLVITTQDNVYKFKIDSDIATKNLEKVSYQDAVITYNGLPYVSMDILKDIYNVKIDYDEETNTISVDKKDTSDINLNYNNVKLYNDLKTNSEVLETLEKNNTVTVYTDSLKHNRWYKVKSDSGKIGYIEKAAVTINTNKENQEEIVQNVSDKKLIMFWQYGSDVGTLGDKIDQVNVVMPTWFELSDESGAVKIDYNKEYFQKAKSNGYKIWPIITNGFDADTTEYKEYTTKMLSSEATRENFIKNIINILDTYKLDGINLDFEYLKDDERNLYTQLLRELYPIMKSNKKTLSVDVYFTSYLDREAIGKACDYFIFMGYDQRGNWSTEAGSIAEVSWEEEKIQSIINDSKVSPSKIILGVPFYTRLWKIDKNGAMSTSVFSMKNSQDFIEKYGLSKVMDTDSGQNYVETNDGDITYKLWIEDADSIKNRVELVNKYGLAGISAWQKGFETDDIWDVLYNTLNGKN